MRGAKRRGNLGKAVAARTSHRRPHALPNLTVAAFPAQPLAALPPYGCGVPLAGSERHAGCQYLRHGFNGMRLPGLSLRGPNGAVAISQDPTESWESHRRNRNCLPEIATSAAPPRNDNSGLHAVLSSACSDRQHCAGSGTPLPYKAPSAVFPSLFRQNYELFAKR